MGCGAFTWGKSHFILAFTCIFITRFRVQLVVGACCSTIRVHAGQILNFYFLQGWVFQYTFFPSFRKLYTLCASQIQTLCSHPCAQRFAVLCPYVVHCSCRNATKFLLLCYHTSSASASLTVRTTFFCTSVKLAPQSTSSTSRPCSSTSGSSKAAIWDRTMVLFM